MQEIKVRIEKKSLILHSLTSAKFDSVLLHLLFSDGPLRLCHFHHGDVHFHEARQQSSPGQAGVRGRRGRGGNR